MLKKCLYCGKEFNAKKKNAKYCSGRCSGLATPHDMLKRREIRYCQWCSKEFEVIRHDPKRFCGQSCSAKWRMSDPEYVKSLGYNLPERKEISRENMLKLRARPDVQEKLYQHLHSESNPFNDPAVREKAKLALREKGYFPVRGGNGRPIPVAQELLATYLGWKTEYILPTKRKSPYPSHYKLDIANEILQVAIEVDGHSHTLKQRQEQDRRKEEFLTEMGWKWIRFSNEFILEHVDLAATEVVALVYSTILKRKPTITMPTDC